MKLLKYKEIIGKSKEKIDELLAPIRANKMQKKAEFEMAKLDEKLLELETKIQDICLEKDINFDSLLECLDDIALLERRKQQYAEIINDLFN